MSEHDIDVCSLESQAEADALTELLADHGIDCLVISNHDTAFDGLWQAQIGWGRLRVRQEDARRATDLVQQWRQAEPETEERRRRREKDRAREQEREQRRARREDREDREVWRERDSRRRGPRDRGE